MANFEIKIYSISNDIITQIELDTNTVFSDWSDEEFIDNAENGGDVFTLCSLFSSTQLFDVDNGTVVRAYLIDVDNENAKPIRCDYYKTILSINKVTSHRADFNEETKQVIDTPIVHFEEELPIPVSKAYTILVTNNDEETTTDDIIHEIELLRDVTSVEPINVIDNKVRFYVTTEIGFEYDTLEETIDDMGLQDCEFINMEFNY